MPVRKRAQIQKMPVPHKVVIARVGQHICGMFISLDTLRETIENFPRILPVYIVKADDDYKTAQDSVYRLDRYGRERDGVAFGFALEDEAITALVDIGLPTGTMTACYGTAIADRTEAADFTPVCVLAVLPSRITRASTLPDITPVQSGEEE
jgi:hypothetical protein